MIKDQQVRNLMKQLQNGKPLYRAAALSDMDRKSARKYVRVGRLPSELQPERTWRSRADPFSDDWLGISEQLAINPGLEAKTIFAWLQQTCPGRYQDGQLRTLQRRMKHWRATEGPGKEVFFPQKHIPGRLCESDFSRMNNLGITIEGRPFDHMVFHFVLTYSNWETGTICFGESFESLSEGLQNALWELGAIPEFHQTDCLSAAVRKPDNNAEFTDRYQGLLRYYKLTGQHSNPASPNENGDVEQSHYRFKKAVAQALMMRGSKDFASRDDYEQFLRKLFDQLNCGRQQRLAEEYEHLKGLPERRLDSYTSLKLRVGSGSTIRVKHNTYSVNSRLIGERITARLYADHLEVWYGQKQVHRLDRLRGDGGYKINYRHIIDSLVRKPGAFARCSYRDELFPTIRFRMAYDWLSQKHSEKQAARIYLDILALAAKQNETKVDAALNQVLDAEESINFDVVEQMVNSDQELERIAEVGIDHIELSLYDDALLESHEGLL